MKLFFDTETTGLVNWKLPFDQQESRMVQLGMILTDDKFNVIHEVGLIVKPVGYEIPNHVAAIHGITNEIAMKSGVDIKLALGLFKQMHDLCNEHIGHNLKFDKAIVSSEFRRVYSFPYLEKKEYCTMLESTSICQLKGPRGFKWPKLSEAYHFFFGEPLEDAHDALTDVRATVRIYRELQERKHDYTFSKSVPETFQDSLTILTKDK